MIRLDNYLVQNSLAGSRTKAQSLIKDGFVSINNKVIKKSSFKLERDDRVEVAEHIEYVSRSAHKLGAFLQELTLDLSGSIALDIGASTGGFTQILLEHSVKEVSAVDVGRQQLHKSLREDSRVISYESCDIRKFESDKTFDIVVSDVSFISLLNILDDIDRLASKRIILLFKPQFEVGREAKRDNHGVVTDKKAILKAMQKFEDACELKGWKLVVKSPSKLTGKEGNLEYCYFFDKLEVTRKSYLKDIKDSTAIAIGGFDGMHIGHQHLFNALGEDGTIVVIETGYANLTPKKERENFSHYPIIYIELDEIRHLSGEEFIELLQMRFPKLTKIVVGYDFHFGKNRKYSFDDLKTLFSGEVRVVDEVSLNGDSIHSHKIRAKIKIGDIRGANNFLGHNYTIRGRHIKGQGIGKKELVATINIETFDFLTPKEGVYVTLTRIGSEEHYHPSVSFVGHRDTTDGSFAIESHILDGEVFCDTKASISFVSFIRDNKEFDSLEELKKAIKSDINIASQRLKLLQL